MGFCLALALIVGGCTSDSSTSGKRAAGSQEKAKLPPSKYPTLPPRANLPPFMKGTVFEVVDVDNKSPMLVSGYGLVVGLAGTGDNNGTPLSVRNHMVDEMVRHGFGTANTGVLAIKPERMVQDPRTAIVEVYAYLPPGGRAGQRIDAFAQAVQGSHTRSLAQGTLYQADLKWNGADPLNPRGGINVFAKAKGPVFVNPTYAVNPSATTRPTGSPNFRSGVIMNGGMVMEDRPLMLRLRTPELRIARAIEARIDQRFQSEATSRTRDEGIVYVLVPKSYQGDWEHFIGVVTHLCLDGSPGVAVVRAKALVAEAVKPDAPLQDISWCWEAIGEDVLPFIQPLYGNRVPDIAYAAARAGACLGDMAAEEALLEMGRTEGHPFQLNAVKTLGSTAQTPRTIRMMRDLLSSSNVLVKIEAYKVLAEQAAPPVYSRRVREQFVIDQIPGEGEPLIYATRSGVPRIAIFGNQPSLRLPVMFSAMNDRLTISSDTQGRGVVVFDRSRDGARGSVQARMSPDIAELLFRLGGGADDGFAFCYSDLVGILQSMSDARHLGARFVLQDSPAMQESIEDAPPIVEPAEPAAP